MVSHLVLVLRVRTCRSLQHESGCAVDHRTEAISELFERAYEVGNSFSLLLIQPRHALIVRGLALWLALDEVLHDLSRIQLRSF